MTDHRLWYIRRNKVVTGPFPEKVIQQHLLVGRLHEDDEVSHDVKQWRRVGDLEGLIPEVMKGDMDDPEAREKLESAKRWADERLSIDRRTEHGPTDHPDRRGEERRSEEDVETISAREVKTNLIVKKREPNSQRLTALVIAFSIVAVIGWGAMSVEPTPIVEIVDCKAEPAPGVNWTSCQLKGRQMSSIDVTGAKARNTDFSGSALHGAIFVDSDLAYANMSLTKVIGADFRNATLVGVDFQLSTLVGSDFQGADLAYANFMGADLRRAKLEGTRLDRTVWVDGSICQEGSVGQCIPSGEKIN